LKKEDLLKEETYLELFFNLKFGSTTNFEEVLLEKNIISSSFSHEFEILDDTVVIGFVGDVLDEEKFVEKIEKELNNTEFDEKVFELYKKSFLASMVRCIDNPSFIARKIFKDIIRYGEFTSYAYDTFKSLNFEEFKKTISKYKFDEKAIVRVKNKED